MIKKGELKKFLVDFAKNGYAAGNEKAWKKETNGSTSIKYKSGKWSVHDNFFGGEPFGGREIVFFEKNPIWIMVYYGLITPEEMDINHIYEFLRKALSHVSPEAPLRGPELYNEDAFTYKNTWTGDIDTFSGKEIIEKDNKIVFATQYIGGLVNERNGI